MSIASLQEILKLAPILLSHNYDIEIVNYDDEKETELCALVSRVYESGRKVTLHLIIPKTGGELFLRNIINTANNIKTIKVSHKDTEDNAVFSTLYKVSEFSDWDIESATCSTDTKKWEGWSKTRPLEISLDFITTPSVPVVQPLEGVKKWVTEQGEII